MLQIFLKGDRISFQNILKVSTTHYLVRIDELKFLCCHKYKQFQTLQQNDCFSLHSLKISPNHKLTFLAEMGLLFHWNVHVKMYLTGFH